MLGTGQTQVEGDRTIPGGLVDATACQKQLQELGLQAQDANQKYLHEQGYTHAFSNQADGDLASVIAKQYDNIGMNYLGLSKEFGVLKQRRG